MAWDITASLPNRPGTLATAAEALAEKGINIDGACMVLVDDVGEFHIAIEGDPAEARQALEGAGVDVRGQREVLIVDAQNRPGELGKLARRMADAGLNIELSYIAGNNRVVLAVEDLAAAKAALA
ncbi:MAG: amino acid-binding ACT domain-containing protein [Acidimicrobiia bacterium]